MNEFKVEFIEDDIKDTMFLGWMDRQSGKKLSPDLMLVNDSLTRQVTVSIDSRNLTFLQRLHNLFFPETYREVEVVLSYDHVSEMADKVIVWIHPSD